MNVTWIASVVWVNIAAEDITGKTAFAVQVTLTSLVIGTTIVHQMNIVVQLYTYVANVITIILAVRDNH